MAQQKVAGSAGVVKLTPPSTSSTSQSSSGSSSSTAGGPGLQSRIEMKKWSAEVDRKMADSTDSANYDPTSGLVWTSQVPTSCTVKGTIEGNLDLTIFNSVIVPAVGTSQAAGYLYLVIGAGQNFGHGPVDFSNLKADSPVEDMVTFSMDFMSNGLFTLGS